MRDSVDRLYKTKRWRRLRQAILIRDSYLCQESKRYGRSVSADVVHHITPAKDDPTRFFDPDNLVSLSAKEHEQMHDRITDELTSKGKRLQREIERRLERKPPYKIKT